MHCQYLIHNNLNFIECRETQQIEKEVGYQSYLEREIFIKRLTLDATNNPRSFGQFIKEARMLASLRHQNVVQVYDVGVDSDNRPYMIIEKPNGILLEKRLDLLNSERAQMDLDEISQIILDISDVLAHVHQHNILIKDLSPANIVLTTQGQTVLTGFGQPLPENIMAASTQTLAYAAPECLFGGQVDHRSDIYSLGVLLYHMLFGQLPFKGQALGIIAQKQSLACLPGSDDPNLTRAFAAELIQVLRRATATQAKNRFSDSAAFRSAFIQALENRPKYTHAVKSQNGKVPTRPAVNGQSMTAPYQPFSPLEQTTLPTWSIQTAKPEAKPTLPRAQFSVEESRPLEEGGVNVPVNQTELDPLMPGRDNPLLQPALAYTTLVPVPETVEEETTAPIARVAARASAGYSWIVGVGMLAIFSILSALSFG